MTKKIFRSIFAATTAVLILSLLVITAVLYGHFKETQEMHLESQLNFAAQGVELNGTDYLNSLRDSNYRLTLIDEGGTVLADTVANIGDMDNHLNREEVTEAMQDGTGDSSRFSHTLMQTMLYSARQLSNGNVLRIAVGVDSIIQLLVDALIPVIIIFLIVIILSVLLSRRIARGIVEPLNKLDLDYPTQNRTYEELSPILGKISRQHKEIANQVKLLREKTDEFEHITSSMSEGLVLLDENGMVLSMNPAAMRIFSVTESKINCDVLSMDRSPEMSKAVRAAFDGTHSEFKAKKNGNEYQFTISRIESDGKTLGAVILGFDITDKAFAERNRQEFTANVTHELKTPLQSIIGSAELLENGLVKPEDYTRFFGTIKNEATRLVNLINDIIRLSQLDEGSEPATETVNLVHVAEEVVDILTPSAAKKKVTLRMESEPCTICGVRRYLYEIIYNLCDNAIRYNTEGGAVLIKIEKEKNQNVISVSDTGIGIAPEHHARIFERFYRVDKSHSRETGGTGLGLSIVKHAVQYHGGRLELSSEVGRGTTIKIIF